MFFSSCAFHALLHEYLSLSWVSLEKKDDGKRKLNKGMIGLMATSGGKSRIVRIHDKLGEFCSSSGSYNW
jgi:hypothetical protein